MAFSLIKMLLWLHTAFISDLSIFWLYIALAYQSHKDSEGEREPSQAATDNNAQGKILNEVKNYL